MSLTQKHKISDLRILRDNKPYSPSRICACGSSCALRLACRYVRAVDGVTSIWATRGDRNCGESGCGKSSLMKTILALYKPPRKVTMKARPAESGPKACAGSSHWLRPADRMRLHVYDRQEDPGRAADRRGSRARKNACSASIKSWKSQASR